MAAMKKDKLLFIMRFFKVRWILLGNLIADDDLFCPNEKYGILRLDVRLRYEQVSRDDLSEVDAVTLRTRLAYQIPDLAGFVVLTEMAYANSLKMGQSCIIALSLQPFQMIPFLRERRRSRLE